MQARSAQGPGGPEPDVAGKSKGKFYCWADVTQQRCLAVECQHLNHVVDSPTKCGKCGAPMDFKCRRKLLPDQRCEGHRTFAKGPAAWITVKPEPATLAQQMSRNMAPEMREIFGRFLQETDPADLLRAQAARQAARVQWKVDRGLLTEEQEAAALKALSYTLDKEQRVRLISKELNPPKLEKPGAYDYSRLTPEKLALLDSLLAEAAVDPSIAAPAELVAARKRLQAPTAEDAWFGKDVPDSSEAVDPPGRAPRRKRVRHAGKRAPRKAGPTG